MLFGQDWPRTVLLHSQSKTALNRTVFVFPVAFKVIPETCGLVKTGPQRYYFQVRAQQALNRTVFVLPAALEVIPETCGLAKTGPEPVLLPSQSKQL